MFNYPGRTEERRENSGVQSKHVSYGVSQKDILTIRMKSLDNPNYTIIDLIEAIGEIFSLPEKEEKKSYIDQVVTKKDFIKKFVSSLSYTKLSNKLSEDDLRSVLNCCLPKIQQTSKLEDIKKAFKDAYNTRPYNVEKYISTFKSFEEFKDIDL